MSRREAIKSAERDQRRYRLLRVELTEFRDECLKAQGDLPGSTARTLASVSERLTTMLDRSGTLGERDDS